MEGEVRLLEILHFGNAHLCYFGVYQSKLCELLEFSQLLEVYSIFYFVFQ